MSEMLMFQEKQTSDGSVYTARYSHAVLSLTSDFYPRNKIEKEARERNSSETHDYRPSGTLATHAIFLSDKTENIAVSLALGNAIGADATVRLVDNTFITGVLTNLENPQAQLIIQQRLFDGNPVGLSVGATVLRNFQAVAINESHCIFCYPSTDFYTTSAGIRTVFTLSPQPPAKVGKPFLYITGNLNYDFTIKTLYPKIGIAFGFY